MLNEIEKVRQNPGEPRRRWFHDASIDLYLWGEEEPVAFQLCVDGEALSWRAPDRYRAEHVERTRGSKMGMSELLLPAPDLDVAALRAAFARAGRGIDRAIYTFVDDRLARCPTDLRTAPLPPLAAPEPARGRGLSGRVAVLTVLVLLALAGIAWWWA